MAHYSTRRFRSHSTRCARATCKAIGSFFWHTIFLRFIYWLSLNPAHVAEWSSYNFTCSYRCQSSNHRWIFAWKPLLCRSFPRHLNHFHQAKIPNPISRDAESSLPHYLRSQHRDSHDMMAETADLVESNENCSKNAKREDFNNQPPNRLTDKPHNNGPHGTGVYLLWDSFCCFQHKR